MSELVVVLLEVHAEEEVLFDDTVLLADQTTFIFICLSAVKGKLRSSGVFTSRWHIKILESHREDVLFNLAFLFPLR